MFCSPKYRDIEKDIMKIRFDNPEENTKVVARSVCGSKGIFDAYLAKKRQEEAERREKESPKRKGPRIKRTKTFMSGEGGVSHRSSSIMQ